MKTEKKRLSRKSNSHLLSKEQENNPFYFFHQANRLLKQDQVELAIKYLEQAGDLGHGGDFGTLGNLYLEGKLVDFDAKKAAECFKKGIACDSIEAKYLLGTLYANGTGVKKDIEKAVQLISECAELGYGYAYFFFGVAYNFGLYNMRQDFVKARYYFEQATKDNLGQAYHNLALLYAQGDGVEQDYTKAANYYEQAINFGYYKSCANLGNMYSEGYGVPQNTKKDVKYYRMGAEFQDPCAMNFLGLCYLSGDGVPEDGKMAFTLFQKAFDLGYTNAAWGLFLCYREGKGVKQNPEKSLEYYLKLYNIES